MITGPELLGVVFWDCVFLALAAIVMRVRRWLRHHHVPHRKLRAAAVPSRSVAARVASVVDVEAKPAPGTLASDSPPGAGPQLRAVGPLQHQGDVPTAARIGGAAVRTPGEPPHPAPGGPGAIPGAGPQPQTAADASRSALYTLASSSGGGLGPKQPVDVGAPRPDIDRCRTHPRGEGDDAAGPRLAASSRSRP